MMRTKEREDAFIQRCREDFGDLTFESEMLLRYGWSRGAQEMEGIAYVRGVIEQQDALLAILGAARKGKQGAEP